MKYCVVILLSKSSISFLYNRDDGADYDKLLPFDRDKLAMPLAIYCSDDTIEISWNAYEEAKKNTPHAYYNIFDVIRKNKGFRYRGEIHSSNKLLYFAIEKYLADFFYSVMFQQVGTLEQNRSTLPVGFIFEADVESKERTFVLTTFKNGGYNNVAEIDYNVSLLKVIGYKGNHAKSALVLSSNGIDLFCDLYKLSSGSLVESIWMKDPWVPRVIDTIWEDIVAFNYNLKKEEELELLEREARDFLNSGRSEMEGCVRLSDGNEYEFFLSRRHMENYSLFSNAPLLLDINEMLCQAKVDPADCMVVLRNQAVGNSFFQKMFDSRFPIVYEETSQIREAILRCILNNIKQNEYDLSQKTAKPVSLEITQPYEEDSVEGSIVSSEKWKQYKREVKGTLAEANSDLRKEDFEKAKHRLGRLLDDLAKEGIHAFDQEIHLFEKEIRALERKGALQRKRVVKLNPEQEATAYSPNVAASQPDPIINVTKWKRKVREEKARAKISMQKDNWEGAAKQLRDLIDELRRQGLSEWDEELILLLKECEERQTSVATETTPQPLATSPSKAYELLRKKEFRASKRAFTGEGNVEMAKICSHLGKISLRVADLSKNLFLEIESGKESVKELGKELGGYKSIYEQYGLDTEELDILIRKLKKSSNH